VRGTSTGLIKIKDGFVKVTERFLRLPCLINCLDRVKFLSIAPVILLLKSSISTISFKVRGIAQNSSIFFCDSMMFIFHTPIKRVALDWVQAPTGVLKRVYRRLVTGNPYPS
jgi:hypothetical protein